MKRDNTIKINFHGGIISPGDLFSILDIAAKYGISTVSFGLRQQLFIHMAPELAHSFCEELKQLDILFETDTDDFPNIMSSYPAEEIFINNTWLSEGVYKDILDGLANTPRLKINISDSNQSFTPMLTGNINWVASVNSPHFWHLFIRFPKTNIIYEWEQLVYTNDVPRVSTELERIILEHPDRFFDTAEAKGRELFTHLNPDDYILKQADKPATLPPFNLPYYEGLNRYNNKFWLGIYRRDELFEVDFLKSLCRLCLDTKIGQLCSTPWKSIIVKGIEEKDRSRWNYLLEKYRVNVRHAANELNFQVDDNSPEGIALKNLLVKGLSNDDTRTFGICIGIKTRTKSEIFSSILVRRKPLITLFGTGFLHVYDILCARNFNPNERTGFVFSRNNPRFLLAEQLRRSVISFYNHRASLKQQTEQKRITKKETETRKAADYIYQCTHCLTIYDENAGEPENSIVAGTAFKDLPVTYTCPLCASPGEDFIQTVKSKLGLAPV